MFTVYVKFPESGNTKFLGRGGQFGELEHAVTFETPEEAEKVKSNLRIEWGRKKKIGGRLRWVTVPYSYGITQI